MAYSVIHPEKLVSGQFEDISVVLQNFQAIQTAFLTVQQITSLLSSSGTILIGNPTGPAADIGVNPDKMVTGIISPNGSILVSDEGAGVVGLKTTTGAAVPSGPIDGGSPSVVNSLIQVRRGTAAAWTAANPTLGAGELGCETDTGRVKIGTGAVAWNSLSYVGREVISVFGRTGAVVAAANDYTDAQIQNSPTNILTSTGDLLYASAPNTLARRAAGTTGQVLSIAAGLPTWANLGYVLLSTTTLGAAGFFDVTGISSAYNDLIVILIGRGTVAANTDTLLLTLNNDTGANYLAERIAGASSAATVTELLAQASFPLGLVPAASATAGSFGFTEWVFSGYASTTWHKMMQVRSVASPLTTTANQLVSVGGGRWVSTAAINRITIKCSGAANLDVGSQLRIYGRL